MMRGLLAEPEFISIDNLKSYLEAVKTAMDIHLEVVYAYTDNLHDGFFQTMSRILTKVYFDKVKLEADPTKSGEDVR